MRIFRLAILSLCCAACMAGAADKKTPAPAPDAKKEAAQFIAFPMKINFDDEGNTINGPFRKVEKWKATDFMGQKEVVVNGDMITLTMGDDMTGITWAGPLVRTNYEIELDAKRVDGEDFFCAVTFPAGKDPCTFVCGGWGGTVVGLSSLEYMDAYNNETCRFKTFEMNHWYHIRIRVTPEKIECWIDDEQFADVDIEGRTIGIRWECEPSRPLGISTWRTTGAIRNVMMRTLNPG
jgi:hypothetical protein